MILAIDVDYRDDKAFVVGVTFSDWGDAESNGSYLSVIDHVASYVPGKFYLREMPCILELIKEHELKPDFIIIDGYVWLDGENAPGLGAHLYNALDNKIPVIGVAKNKFKDITKGYELLRGDSKKPLYVTCVGLSINQAIQNISKMAGEHRFPKLLKQVDRLCRES